MIDIVIGNTNSVHNNEPPRKIPKRSMKKGPFKDKRKNPQDRRKSVRDGVFVSISYKYDRRVNPDRRKRQI